MPKVSISKCCLVFQTQFFSGITFLISSIRVKSRNSSILQKLLTQPSAMLISPGSQEWPSTLFFLDFQNQLSQKYLLDVYHQCPIRQFLSIEKAFETKTWHFAFCIGYLRDRTTWFKTKFLDFPHCIGILRKNLLVLIFLYFLTQARFFSSTLESTKPILLMVFS